MLSADCQLYAHRYRRASLLQQYASEKKGGKKGQEARGDQKEVEENEEKVKEEEKNRTTLLQSVEVVTLHLGARDQADKCSAFFFFFW